MDPIIRHTSSLKQMLWRLVSNNLQVIFISKYNLDKEALSSMNDFIQNVNKDINYGRFTVSYVDNNYQNGADADGFFGNETKIIVTLEMDENLTEDVVKRFKNTIYQIKNILIESNVRQKNRLDNYLEMVKNIFKSEDQTLAVVDAHEETTITADTTSQTITLANSPLEGTVVIRFYLDEVNENKVQTIYESVLPVENTYYTIIFDIENQSIQIDMKNGHILPANSIIAVDYAHL